MDNLEKIINELPVYEKKLLKTLKKDIIKSPKEIATETGMDIKSVMSAAGSLASKNIIKVETIEIEKFKLTDNGINYYENNLPERIILNVLKEKNEIAMKELSNYLDGSDVKIAIGWLARKKWAKIDKGVLKLTEIGEKYFDKLFCDEELLKLSANDDFMDIDVSTLNDDLKEGLNLLKSRKDLIEIKTLKNHEITIEDLGLAILKHGFEIKDDATQLTHEQLKTGEYKNLNYRPYDINAEFPKFYAGKVHPLGLIIEEIREIFLNLGFTESIGSILDSAFWNFDSLFQPQDHAAREMQDTFYMKNPAKCDLPNEDLVKRTKDNHEFGGNTGSDGWNYNWNEEIAKQSVLRTHTTGISTRFLADNQAPLKMFSVGRVFRRETITYKHLPEFHQVEGIVAGEDINYQNLLGILKEFYKKLGFEVRFRPAYFPYTYLSTECEVYLEEKESWIELGGSGMFRPEVLEPLGVDVPVLAFGLGIERLAMIRYDISDIRMLYKSDIKWLRELPVCDGINFE
ncbi:MAG: phenylalanine--tRNA ligase subunit alpha [Methanobrevibacter sp.]|jgi:phenylalanyl-tRNA synthetase alpha chain|nr:phenylalanine--tRNA ligase subunit alpha [Candidatus Methanoflexus mossambicus]